MKTTEMRCSYVPVSYDDVTSMAAYEHGHRENVHVHHLLHWQFQN